jgi:hypothetical protein
MEAGLRCTVGPRFSPLQPFKFEDQLQRKMACSRMLTAGAQFADLPSAKQSLAAMASTISVMRFPF